jgi:hypothetical protein
LKLSEQPESQNVQAVGRDLDRPTDEQSRDGVYKNEWQNPRQTEQEQLQRYDGMYSKVEGIPEGYKTVDTKWVYVIKRNPNGSIKKFKARKVGRGFSQEKGIDYDKTYAQMARIETWRVMLTVALSKGWKIRQWDVVAAHLQAKLEHTVYIKDLNEEGKIEYWILHKALHGLKQAAHEWSKKLKQILEYAGFQRSGWSERHELDTTTIRGNENQINNRTDNPTNGQRCSTETLSRHSLPTENTRNSGENESSRSIDEIDFSALFEGMDEGNWDIGMDWSTIDLNL